MTVRDEATHHFAAEDTSAAAARRFVRRILGEWSADDVVDDAVLLTNELVTNAVLHAGTDVHVGCARGADYVQIGVTDTHGSRALPAVVSNSSSDKTSGRGLYLLSQIAHEWGVEYARSSKRVWFRLLLPSAVQPVPAPAPPGHFVDLGGAAAPIHVAVVETDTAGLVGHWSAEAEHLLGWPAADVVGRPLADLVSTLPADCGGDGGPQSFADVLALPRWCGEYRVRTPQGAEVAVFASQMHATVGEQPRVVTVLVQAAHRALLMPGSPGGHEPEATPVQPRPGLLPLDALLELAVEHSRDLLEGDVAYALLVTDDDLEVELRAVTGIDPAQAGVRRWSKPPELAGGAEGHAPLVYGDVAEATIPEQFLAGSGMHGLVTAPLLVDDRIIGRVGVAARRPRAFGEDDATRLQRSVGRFALAVASARLNEMERVRRGRLSYLAEASDLLAGTLDPDMAAALTAQLVVPRLADWCAVYLTDQRRTGRLSCVWHAKEELIDPLRSLLLRVPQPLLEESGRPHQWAALHEHLSAVPESPADIELVGGPSVTVTLLARGRPVGTLVAGRGAGRDFPAGALDTLDDLCRRAAWSLDNARLYSERAEISTILQRSLLPTNIPAVDEVDVGLAYEAAGEGIAVGGDFYDLFVISPGRWGFAIGDVCGKGSLAAAVTGLTRHSLRVLAREHDDVPTILSRLNSTILREGDATRFVTMVYGELRLVADGIEVTFAAAGHPLPMLVDRDGTVEPVGTPQQLLGVFTRTDYATDSVTVRRGQHLVCTTDGVTDRRIGSRTVGEVGLQRLLQQTSTLPASAVAARLRQAVLDFGPEPLQDDFAVLVLQPTGPGF
jgi:PAS domain-containing protein